MTMNRKQFRPRRILAVAIGCLFLMQAAFYFIVPWWHPDAEYRVHREALQARISEHPDHPLFVMVGSSRVSFGFDPECLSPVTDNDGKPVLAFNFGHFNAGPTSNLLMADRLRRARIKPRWLVIEVLPALCFRDWTGFVHTSSWGDVKTVASYFPLIKYGGSVLKNHLLLPWFEYRGELQERYLHEKQEERRELLISQFGWWTGVGEEIEPGLRQKFIEGQRGSFSADLSGEFHLSTSSEAALRELLAHCQKEQIAVALIMMPEGNTFRSWYSPSAEEELQACLDKLAADFAVPIFDTREWFDDSYFSDSHHLMRPGTRAFTHRFEQEIMLPLIRGQVPAESHHRLGNSTAQRRDDG